MKILSHKLFILITLLLAVSACRDEDFSLSWKQFRQTPAIILHVRS